MVISHAEWNRQQHALHGNTSASPKRSAIITYNHTSLSRAGKLKRLCDKVRTLGERDGLQAYCAQETKLSAADHDDHLTIARKAQVVASFSYGPTSNGGTCVLIPMNAVKLADGETFTEAIDRVTKSARGLRTKGGFASLDTYIGERKYRIASVYAPVEPHLRPRFFRQIGTYVTKKTILCGDYNCVLDQVADLQRTSTYPYQNQGASELAELVADRELFDTHRHSLGDEKKFTFTTATTTGSCHSRIDRIYAPEALQGHLWDTKLDNTISGDKGAT